MTGDTERRTMIERVALAMYARYPHFQTDESGKRSPLPFDECPFREMFLDDAAAAIEAMRYPTDEMLVMASEATRGRWKSCEEAANDHKRVLQAMIDAALKE